jgi:hypothetical protein
MIKDYLKYHTFIFLFILEIKKPKIIKLSKVSETSKKKKKFKCGFCLFQNNNYKKVLTHEKRHKKFR